MALKGVEMLIQNLMLIAKVVAFAVAVVYALWYYLGVSYKHEILPIGNGYYGGENVAVRNNARLAWAIISAIIFCALVFVKH